MGEAGSVQDLAAINHRADLGTFHPDALPWPKWLDTSEVLFHAQLCDYPPVRCS